MHLRARRRRRQADHQVFKWGKLYDESVDLQVVIKTAMDKAATEAESSLCFVKAEAYASAEAMSGRGTVLDNDDLPDMTVGDGQDGFRVRVRVKVKG